MADLNSDGIRDIVSGSWPGDIYVIPGRKDGTFGKPYTLKDRNGKSFYPGPASNITLNDWDRDGDLDIIAGTFFGAVKFYPNEGDYFGDAIVLKADGVEIEEDHGGADLADWDGNGTVDLIIGNGKGQITFYPNLVKVGMPQLGKGTVLLPNSYLVGVASGTVPEHIAASVDLRNVPGNARKVDVVDWNGDGKLDLLFGDITRIELTEEAPELTEAQEARLDEIDREIGRITNRANVILLGLMKDSVRELGIPERTKDRAQKAKLNALWAKKQKENREYQEISAQSQALVAESEAMEAPMKVEGRVWVYLRK